MEKVIKSRIREQLPTRVIDRLWDICNRKTVLDNNTKANMIIDMLTEEQVDFTELGPGTNRLAILIDNYVYKLAMDKWGVYDNLNEFAMSYELQPYVVKTYETNGVISVCEYVTLISREEFTEEKETLKNILAMIADSYLLGDVGIVEKNFTNWGYRDNNELVILDYAYIYRVDGMDLHCTSERCEGKQRFIEYTSTYSKLYCPHCSAQYEFIDIRRRITQDQEYEEHQDGLDNAYRVTSAREIFVDEQSDEEVPGTQEDGEVEDSNSPEYISSAYSKEETTMRENYERPYEEEEDEFEAMRQATYELLEQKRRGDQLSYGDSDGDVMITSELNALVDGDVPAQNVNMVHIHREDESTVQDIRIVTTEKDVDVERTVHRALEATSDGIINVIEGVSKVEADAEKLLEDQAKEEELKEQYESEHPEEESDTDETPSEDVYEDVDVEGSESEEEPEVEQVSNESDDEPSISVSAEDNSDDHHVEVIDARPTTSDLVQATVQASDINLKDVDGTIRIDSSVTIDPQTMTVRTESHVGVYEESLRNSFIPPVEEDEEGDSVELDDEQIERLKQMEAADKIAEKFDVEDDEDDEDPRTRGNNRAWT